MLTEVPFGPFEPDKAASKSNHLTEATNVRPIVNGFAPVEGFQAITPTLGAAFYGGGSFISTSGTSSLLAGTSSNLRRYQGGAWADVITDTATRRWRFTQFGNNVICSNGGKLISYDLSAGTAAEIASSPANAIDVCSVRDFVMCLRDDDNAEWCEFNNSQNWGTSTNQADFQPLLDGGRGVGIVGGEYGIILQSNAVRRVSYVGGSDIVFQFDKISAEVGCMTQGSICSVGKLIGFLSERGFMISDGAEIKPVGDEKFNRWFFDTYPRTQIETMWSAIDPRNSLMLWGVPGVPGKIIAYNWVLNTAAPIELDFTGLFSGFTASTAMDSLDPTYPTLEAMTPLLDDPSFQGGNPLILAVNADNIVGSLTGASLEAKFRIRNLEPTPGRRSRIRALRPVTDALSVTASIDARMRSGDEQNVVSCSAMRANGKMPIRANGRFATIDMTIPAGTAWSYAQGMEIEFEPGDVR